MKGVIALKLWWFNMDWNYWYNMENGKQIASK